jgi:hypothetical protein
VVDAARIEPVSTSNSLLAGNLAGNFLKKGPPRAILASKTRAASIAYEQIPCCVEQGIFLHEQGILSRAQGILRWVDPTLGLRLARVDSGATAGRWSNKSSSAMPQPDWDTLPPESSNARR